MRKCGACPPDRQKKDNKIRKRNIFSTPFWVCGKNYSTPTEYAVKMPISLWRSELDQTKWCCSTFGVFSVIIQWRIFLSSYTQINKHINLHYKIRAVLHSFHSPWKSNNITSELPFSFFLPENTYCTGRKKEQKIYTPLVFNGVASQKRAWFMVSTSWKHLINIETKIFAGET